jgi:hypothetical protein
MSLLSLTVELVAGVGHTDKRGVAILRGDDDLNAGPQYDKIESSSLGKRLRHRMGLWISGVQDMRGKFHRFKAGDAKHRDCFAFIDLEEKVRLYGFTCHPLPITNQRFELVVLTTHAFKKENETDKAELERVVMWRNHMATRQALREKFPDKKD